MTDLYETLGVSRDAPRDEIKRAYRRKARETHPDAGGTAEAFRKVQAAYDTLGDDEARRRYDASFFPRRPGLSALDVSWLDVSMDFSHFFRSVAEQEVIRRAFAEAAARHEQEARREHDERRKKT